MPIKNVRLQKNCQTMNPQIQIVVVGGGGDRTQAIGGLAVGGEGAGVGLGAGVKAEGELVGASQQLRGDFNRSSLRCRRGVISNTVPLRSLPPP